MEILSWGERLAVGHVRSSRKKWLGIKFGQLQWGSGPLKMCFFYFGIVIMLAKFRRLSNIMVD
jgi:hypothetical protein